MFITWIVTFLTAVLSGLGVGSAGLLVIWFTAVEKLPQLTAQGLNLAFFLAASGGALVLHVLRQPLPWRAILLLLPGGLLGCFFGAELALVLPRALLRRLFGGFLILSGIAGFWRKRK